MDGRRGRAIRRRPAAQRCLSRGGEVCSVDVHRLRQMCGGKGAAAIGDFMEQRRFSSTPSQGRPNRNRSRRPRRLGKCLGDSRAGLRVNPDGSRGGDDALWHDSAREQFGAERKTEHPVRQGRRREFPPPQKPAGLRLAQVMEKVAPGLTSKNRRWTRPQARGGHPGRPVGRRAVRLLGGAAPH